MAFKTLVTVIVKDIVPTEAVGIVRAEEKRLVTFSI